MVGRLLKKGLIVSAAVIGAEALYAALRSAPVQPEFDPSGTIGHPDLPPLHIVVLGDSSITAPGVSTVEQIWVRIVAEMIARDRHVVLRSVAVGGATAASVVADQLEAALSEPADLALVSIGGNDAIRGVPVQRFERDLELIATKLRAHGAEVALSGLGDLGTIPRLWPPLRGVMTRRSLAYDRAHQRVADRVDAIWLNPRQDDRDLWIRDRSLWSEDLFHVSSHGHARWADSCWKTIQPVLARLDG